MNSTNYKPFAKYTEVGPDGDILFQSESVPSFARSSLFPAQRSFESPSLTSNEYRTFNIPSRFERPDWWEGYSQFPRHPFYRTTNQEYGGYKPVTHTMPTIYRTKSHDFTDMMRTGENYRNRSLNTSFTKLPSIGMPRGTLPMAIDRVNYKKHF